MGSFDKYREMQDMVERMQGRYGHLGQWHEDHLAKLADLANPPWMKWMRDLDYLKDLQRSTSAHELLGLNNDIAKSLLTGYDEVAKLYASSKPPAFVEDEIARIQRSMDLIGSMPAAASLTRALAGWDVSVRSLTAQIEESAFLRSHPELGMRLLAPAEQYGGFVRETSERLADERDAPTSPTARALEGSLVLAEEAFVENAGETEEFVAEVEEGEESTVVIVETRESNAFYMLQQDLLDAAGSIVSLEIEELVALSTTRRTVEVARSVLRLVQLINTERKMRGKDETFTPTTRLLQLFAEFAFFVPVTTENFGLFVDDLYSLLYEGAGKDNLRYDSAKGGEIAMDEARIVFVVKHLRNTFFRHDADHGDEKKSQKKWKELLDDLKWLGLSRLPSGETDFIFVHRRMLEETETLLQRILAKLQDESL